MKRRATLIMVVLAIAILATIGYFMSSERVSLAPDQIPSSQVEQATTTDQAAAVPPSPDDALPLPSATSSDMAVGWSQYANRELGYSISYPSDAILSGDGTDAETFILPKSSYFHWPLLDDAKVTMTVATSCPAVSGHGALGASSTPKSFSLNGISFVRTVGHDVAAGNVYLEIAYDATSGGSCYHLSFFDHGANGAGLYVDDASLIDRYDRIHEADLAHAIDAFNAMAATLRLVQR